MNTFCCCVLKRHSYFLLINYITMGIAYGVTQTAAYDLYHNKNYTNIVRYFLSLFILFSIVMSIMAFVAFMVYIFNDSWTNKYQQIYVKTTNVWLITGLVVLSFILLSSLFGANIGNDFQVFVGTWVLAIIFMAFDLKWNLTVQKNLNEFLKGQDDEENRRLNPTVESA